MHADAVIVATGGISYPSTGATGDGYRMAEESGHKMVSPTPALVPMELKEPWVRDLQGLSLRNVRMSVTRGKKKLYEDFGEMLFYAFRRQRSAGFVGKRMYPGKKHLTRSFP